MRQDRIQSIAQLGMLTAAALALGWLERFIPVIPAIPGIKLGLANTTLLYAIYMMGGKNAAVLMALKVVLSGFLFSGLSGMAYSFMGGLFSLSAMLLFKKLPRATIIAVSIVGAVAHNAGQIAVACLVIMPRAALAYLPILTLCAVFTGLLTGIAAKYALKALNRRGDNLP